MSPDDAGNRSHPVPGGMRKKWRHRSAGAFMHHQGGCLCGRIRYRVDGAPRRVTICHCRFCQRLTGSAFLVEAIFPCEAVELQGDAPSTYDLVSAGSGKRVTINSCGHCSTSLMLSFERFPDICGIPGGTFDDPNWVHRSSAPSRHIFVATAQDCVTLAEGSEVHLGHAIRLDGTLNEPRFLKEPTRLSRA